MRLLEREGELAEVETALHAALAGRGGLIVVEGSPGIGRLALPACGGTVRAGARCPTADRARAGASASSPSARCGSCSSRGPAATSEERNRLFAGASTPARQLFETAAPRSGLAADPEFATLNALYWLLAGLADAEPLALVIDDAHWLDSPSLRLLDFLGRGSRSSPPPRSSPPDRTPRTTPGRPLGRLLADPASCVIRPRSALTGSRSRSSFRRASASSRTRPSLRPARR